MIYLLSFLLAAFAQHAFTPEEIAEGGRLFQSNCAGCHGTAGDQIQGVALMSGKFRRATTDEDAAAIIRKGVPGTAMASFNFTEQQAGSIVAYLKSFSAAASNAATANTVIAGNATRGKQVFEGKGECVKCHRVGETGSRTGPDLSAVGIPRPGTRFVGFGGAPPSPPTTAAILAKLEQSLVDPDAEIATENRTYRAVLKDGKVVTGRMLNLDIFTVQFFDSNDRLVSLQRSDLRELNTTKSPMPSYRDKFTRDELSDLLAYLASLKGAQR